MAVKLPPALFFVSPRWWSAAALCLLALALVLAFAAPAALADDDDDRSTRDSFRDSDRSGDPSSARYSRFIAGEFARDEVIATRVTPAQLATLRERGYAVLEQRSDGLINAITARLRVPGRLTLDQALAEIASLNAESVADRNHFYRAIGGASSCDGPHCATASLIEWPAAGAACPRRARVTIGLIDTGIQRDHPALAQQAIDIVQMRPGERRASGTGHGTAIASLLVGARDGPAPGLMPDARLIAIDAFYRGSFSDDRVDAYQLEAAIEELIKRGARVLNFSFAGPSNRVLELGVAAAYKKGKRRGDGGRRRQRRRARRAALPGRIPAGDRRHCRAPGHAGVPARGAGQTRGVGRARRRHLGRTRRRCGRHQVQRHLVRRAAGHRRGRAAAGTFTRPFQRSRQTRADRRDQGSRRGGCRSGVWARSAESGGLMRRRCPSGGRGIGVGLTAISGY
jgi:hypothetical protein